jgi:hypothetical protein
MSFDLKWISIPPHIHFVYVLSLHLLLNRQTDDSRFQTHNLCDDEHEQKRKQYWKILFIVYTHTLTHAFLLSHKHSHTHTHTFLTFTNYFPPLSQSSIYKHSHTHTHPHISTPKHTYIPSFSHTYTTLYISHCFYLPFSTSHIHTINGSLSHTLSQKNTHTHFHSMSLFMVGGIVTFRCIHFHSPVPSLRGAFP